MKYDVNSINLLVNPSRTTILENYIYLLLLFCIFPHKKVTPVQLMHVNINLI